MSYRYALVGNPNCGKTTLFNAVTGSNQYVGNWPGVTVEKKEGKITHDNMNAYIVDLPGIYSLSPYSSEEIVTRNYIIDEKPDLIINIVDATNLERNLYLSMQLAELGIPMVIALNMIDMVEKRGDNIDLAMLSSMLGIKIVPISASKGTGIHKLLHTAMHEALHGDEKTAEKHIDRLIKSRDYLSDAEIKNIHWLTKKELAYNSVVVLAFCFLFGIYFYGSDAVIALILKALGLN